MADFWRGPKASGLPYYFQHHPCFWSGGGFADGDVDTTRYASDSVRLDLDPSASGDVQLFLGDLGTHRFSGLSV